MNKKKLKIAGFALGLSLALAGVGIAAGASMKAPVETKAATDSTKYSLINSTEDLEAGKSYLITNGTSGTVRTMATTSNTNNRPTTDVTVVEGKITRGSSAMSVTLGGSSGAWTFACDNYAGSGTYLGQGNQTGSNYLKVYSEVGAGANGDTWTISFEGDSAVITSTKQSSRNVIRCNNNGTPISCYTSGQDPVYLWKESLIDQIITASADEAYANDKITLSTNATTTNWSITANTAGATLSADSGKSTVVSASQEGSVTVQAAVSGYTTVSKTLTFNAVTSGFDVTFDSAGGSNSPSKLIIEENGTFAFPSPGTKAHHSFLGWSSDGGTTKYAVGATSPAVVDDIAYTAYWLEDSKVTVTYSAGANGTGTFEHTLQYVGDYTLLEFASLTGVSAASGYRFLNYTVGGAEKKPGNTISLSVATTVTVNFELCPLETTFDYSDIEGFSSWNNQYPERTIDHDGFGTTIFRSASRQTTNITDIPVTKGGDVEFICDDNIFIIAVNFVCRQWTTKAQTITLNYSIDGGSSYESTDVTSTNFALSDSTHLPVKTNAVKFTFNNSSNQVGIQSLNIVYEIAWARLMINDFTCSGAVDSSVNPTGGYITAANPSTVWSNVQTAFNAMSTSEKAALKTMEANEEGTLEEKALARYDLVVKKYTTDSYPDFIGRFSEGGINYAAAHNLMKNYTSDDNATIYIALFAGVGVAAVALGGCFFIRRRKES